MVKADIMPISFAEFEKRFVPTPNYRINVPWDYLEENLARWTDSREGCAPLNLEPDFQRCHVWTTEQQIKYVEYILSGGMSGREIYFNCAGWMKDWVGPFVIVDGKQRLYAVRQFLANRLPIFGDYPGATKKAVLKIKGFYRSEIEGRLSLNAQFIFAVNDLKTRAEVLKWYLEMNTGGTPHTPEEIAKATNLLAKCTE